MKTNIRIFIILSALVCTIACETKPEPLIDYAIVSGKITNTTSIGMVLSWRDNFNVNPTRSLPIKISADGTFLDTLKIMPGHYTLAEGENKVPLHIANGVDINIAYDANDFKNTIQFIGKGSGTSYYLTAKQDKISSIFSGNNGVSFFNAKEADFKEKVNTIKSDLEKTLADTKNITNDVRAKEKREIHYSYLDFINRYIGVYHYVSGDSTYVPSKEFKQELEALTYNHEEDFMFSSTYQYLLLQHFRDKANKIAAEKGTSKNIEFLKSLSNIPNETIKNIMIMFYGKSGLPSTGSLDLMYNLVMNNSTNTEDKEEFTNLYNDLKELTKGQPSPTFENYENYAGGTTSLSDLKGKYVFIDVWATWCGPCKYEIPFLEKLEKEYHNKNIVFISLSVDRKNAYNAWKQMIKDKNMGGMQLLADNAFQSKFIQDYKIGAIPKFILIDPEGNIVSANVPNPSSKEIRGVLNKIL